MPENSNEDAKIDELLAELKNETSEEKPLPKKEHKNDDYNEYDVSDDTNLEDAEW